jgi:hypothetical protein
MVGAKVDIAIGLNGNSCDAAAFRESRLGNSARVVNLLR